MNARDIVGSLAGIERRAMAGAIAAAMLIAGSSILLLALSGWFLTSAAVAAAGGIAAIQALNYLLPSAAIRLLAIARTAGRYGERLWSHQAALQASARLRAQLFARIAQAPAADALALMPGNTTARLIDAIDGIQDMVVRRPARPAAIAAALCGLALAALAGPWPPLVLALAIGAVAWGTPVLARRWLNRPAEDAQQAIGTLKRDLVSHAAAAADILVYDLQRRITAIGTAQADLFDQARRRLAIGEARLNGLLLVIGGIATGGVILLAEAAAPIVALAALGAAGTIEALAAMVRGHAREGMIAAGLDRIPYPPTPAAAATSWGITCG
jgi:ATP-binding cassette subfamily C protein CydC